MATKTEIKDQINVSVSKAVKFLAQNQLPYGEFRTYASTCEELTDCIFDSSPFGTALILYSLGFTKDPRVAEITRKAVDFLAQEKEEGSLWRYWSSRNPRHPISPPDLDDTACVASVLRKFYSPLLYSFLFPSNLNLFLSQRNERGLFHTFFSPSSNNPIDSVVNANVLVYLGETEETKAVCDYLNEIILGDQEQGSDISYYREIALYYSMSKAYSEGAKSLEKSQAAIIRKVLALQQEKPPQDDLEMTLSICTLLNYQYQDNSILEKLITDLLRHQQEQGCWSRSSFWRLTAEFALAGDSMSLSEMFNNCDRVFWGSEELTTAFCIEALTKYRQKKLNLPNY